MDNWNPQLMHMLHVSCIVDTSHSNYTGRTISTLGEVASVYIIRGGFSLLFWWGSFSIGIIILATSFDWIYITDSVFKKYLNVVMVATESQIEFRQGVRYSQYSIWVVLYQSTDNYRFDKILMSHTDLKERWLIPNIPLKLKILLKNNYQWYLSAHRISEKHGRF